MSVAARRWARALVGLAVAMTACRTVPHGDDWGDRPVLGTAPLPAARPFDQASVEAGLLALGQVRERLRLRGGGQGAPSWPTELTAVWTRLLGLIEEELAWSANPPARLLLQTRVITEAEREAAARFFGEPPPEVDVRLGRLYARVRHHLERQRPDPSAPRMGWPVAPVIISSPFGLRRDPVHGASRLHKGLDLAGRHGDVVSAAAAGVVTSAGWMGGYGNAVTIDHGDGLETLYGHLSQVLVQEGAPLADGDALGLMGSSGRSTGPHLHFEVWKDGAPMDPLTFVEPWRNAVSSRETEASP